MRKTFTATIVREGSMCFIPVPFDPKPLFGKVRAPVIVSLAGHSYRSTIAALGNGPCLPLRRSNREAAGLTGTETVKVTLELDEAPRVVAVPRDLAKALSAVKAAKARWHELSYSHQKEFVDAIDAAKKPETRARRVAATVEAVVTRPAKSNSRSR